MSVEPSPCDNLRQGKFTPDPLPLARGSDPFVLGEFKFFFILSNNLILYNAVFPLLQIVF